MKKIISLLLVGVMACAVFVSCGKKAEESAPAVSVTASEVFDAINEEFAEKYAEMGAEGAINNMPMDVDDVLLTEKFGIDPAAVEDYRGQIAGMMTNCDMLLVVKAKEGELENVVAGLEKGQADQTAQFESYGVMGNLERLDASKVVTNGNFAALLMVGVMPDDAETIDFTPDVQMAEEAFNNAIAGK